MVYIKSSKLCEKLVFTFNFFFDKTNPGLHVQFFLDLFKRVYSQDCKVGTQKEHMEIANACAEVINKIFPMGENLS